MALREPGYLHVQQGVPAGVAQPQINAAQSHAMQIDVDVPSTQPPSQPQPQFRSSLETAALASSASVRDKVKQQGSSAVIGEFKVQGLHQQSGTGHQIKPLDTARHI